MSKWELSGFVQSEKGKANTIMDLSLIKSSSSEIIAQEGNFIGERAFEEFKILLDSHAIILLIRSASFKSSISCRRDYFRVRPAIYRSNPTLDLPDLNLCRTHNRM